MTVNTEVCGIDGCDKTPPTVAGLAIHRSKAHGVKATPRAKPDVDEHEDAAIRRAERQPIEGDDTAPPDVVDEDEPAIARWVIGRISIDAEEVELIEAMRFLFGFDTDDDILCAALNDLFAWARDDATVKKLLKLRESLGETGSTR